MQKKESKYKAIDLAIIVFCFAGAFFSGAAFWREYNATLEKINEEPVGTIIFKKRVAQRKFIDRNMWDRLKQASYVYNGDMIRTIEQSEAIVIFQDEVTSLSMDESTMIQILYDRQGGARIDFSSGNLEVLSENKNIVITSGTSTITVEGQARMEKSDEGFMLSVSEGQARFNNTDMAAGSILAVDSGGEPNTDPLVAMTSFGSSAYVLGSAAEAFPVDFSWNAFYFGPGTHVIVEVAADRGFKNVVETRDIVSHGVSSVSVPLECGSYWWRVFPVNGPGREPANRFYPSGTLELIPAAKTVLVSPPHAAELVFPGETLVPLSWSAAEGAASYLVEISARADMGNPVVSRHVMENSVTQAGLDFGRWHWRITPVFPARIKGSAVPSAVGEFSAIRGRAVLAPPVLTFPPQGGKLSAGSGGRLLWDHDPDAASWLVELADNPAMANPAVKQYTASNYFSLSRDLLRAGKSWYWRVSAQGGAGPAVSAVWKFSTGGEGEPSGIPRFSPLYFGANIGNWDDLDSETAAGNDKILLQIAEFLNANSDFGMRVEGHANPTVNPGDADGRRRENILELLPISEMRAKAVVDKLVTLGVDPSRLQYRGHGGRHPVATWEDTRNWRKNRRVEFIPEIWGAGR